jgi:HSP20 family protein
MFVRVNFDQPISDLVEEFLTEEFVPVKVSQPAIDVAENENESVIVAELPGVKKEDISISVENGWLTLKGERKATESSEIKRVLHREIAYVPFSRSIKLPHAVNVNNISAELANGILRVSLPKAEEIRARAIEIK